MVVHTFIRWVRVFTVFGENYFSPMTEVNNVPLVFPIFPLSLTSVHNNWCQHFRAKLDFKTIEDFFETLQSSGGESLELQKHQCAATLFQLAEAEDFDLPFMKIAFGTILWYCRLRCSFDWVIVRDYWSPLGNWLFLQPCDDIFVYDLFLLKILNLW